MILASAAAAAISGAIAGLAAAALPPTPVGSIALLARFDRTLIAVLGFIAVFTTIRRITDDASSDWLLQLVCAGARREAYVIGVAFAVAASMVLMYCAGALAFAATVLLRADRTAVIARVAPDLFVIVLPILASVGFGAALSCLFTRAAAPRVASFLMMAPWIALWLTIAAHGELDTAAAYLRLLEYPVPRLYVEHSLKYVSAMLLYIGIAFLIVIQAAHVRIGRRA